MGSVGLVFSMSGHIVNALVLIQLRLDIVVVGLVLYQKFNLGEIPLAVGEQLGKIDTVGVNVGIVYQGIIESLAGALPGQDNLVVVWYSILGCGYLRCPPAHALCARR